MNVGDKISAYYLLLLLLLAALYSCSEHKPSSGISSKRATAQLHETFDYSLTFSTPANYVLSNAADLSFSGGAVSLAALDHLYSNSTTFDRGTYSSTEFNAGVLRLDSTTNDLDATLLPRQSSLLGFWKFNGNALDSGPNGYHGILGAASVFDSASPYNGTAYANFGPNNSQITLGTFNNTSNNLTVSAWMNWAGGTGAYQAFIVKRLNWDTSATGVRWAIALNNGGDNTILAANGTAGIDGNDLLYSADNALNRWMHVIMTQTSGGEIKLYINGSLVLTDTAATPTNSIATGVPVFVGGIFDGTEQFNGKVDDVIIWDDVLTSSEVAYLHHLQAPKTSGTFTSEVFDAKSVQPWSSFTAKTALPFSKRLLPGQNESSTDYSAITGSLSTGLIHYFSFDTDLETASVGANGVLFVQNGSIESGAGILGKGLHARRDATENCPLGQCDLYTVPDASFTTFPTAASTFTYSLFVKRDYLNDPVSGRIIFQYGWGLTGLACLLMTAHGAPDGGNPSAKNQLLFVAGSQGAAYDLRTTTILEPSKWYHIVVTQDGVNRYLYVNGVLEATALSSGCDNAGGELIMTGSSYTQYNFFGSIDEFGTWNRALSALEVMELSRRFMNQVNYQFRACTTSNCSDQEALVTNGKGWKGSSGTPLSFFSEFNNNIVNSLSINFSDFVADGYVNSDARYFQYRALLSSQTTTSPEILSLAPGPNHYATQATVTSASPVTFKSLNTFLQTLGTDGCAGNVTYQLSTDNSTWEFFNGAAFATVGSLTDANQASVMQTNLLNYKSTDADKSLYVKTILNSNGITPCSLDNLQIKGGR